jgi:hypothetical protein
MFFIIEIPFSFGSKYTSPLAPLQPALTGTPQDFLAGEGIVTERGLRPLSELTSPFQTLNKRAWGIIRFERGIKGG